jgi:hypothetical protein
MANQSGINIRMRLTFMSAIEPPESLPWMLVRFTIAPTGPLFHDTPIDAGRVSRLSVNHDGQARPQVG